MERCGGAQEEGRGRAAEAQGSSSSSTGQLLRGEGEQQMDDSIQHKNEDNDDNTHANKINNDNGGGRGGGGGCGGDDDFSSSSTSSRSATEVKLFNAAGDGLGARHSIVELRQEYKSNPQFQDKIEDLIQRYDQNGWSIRAAKRDGDCFYRSYFFCVLCRLALANPAEARAVAADLRTRLAEAQNAVINQLGYSEHTVGDFFEMVTEIVDDVEVLGEKRRAQRKEEEGGMKEKKEDEEEEKESVTMMTPPPAAAEEEGEADEGRGGEGSKISIESKIAEMLSPSPYDWLYLCTGLRLLVSYVLRTNEERFSPFLMAIPATHSAVGCYTTMESFCKHEVDPMKREVSFSSPEYDDGRKKLISKMGCD